MTNFTAIIVAGLAGAIVFSMVTAMARAMGMTKMSIEKMLGAMFGEGATADALGWMMHLVSGIIFAFIYVVIFKALGITNGWLYGAIFGLIQGVMVGAIVLPMMSVVHPAIIQGKIEAPGFFGHKMGPMTPMGIIIGHIIFGAVVGGIYFLLA